MTTTGSTSFTTSVSSSGAVTLSGGASGLDTSSIISQLMTIASAQKTALQTKLTTQQTNLTTFQNLNSALSTLATSATAAASGGATAMSGTSTDSSITVTASAGATASNLQLQVTQLATRHTVVSGAMTAWSDSSNQITITKADGTSTTLTASSSNPADIVSAVNKANLGITATRIAAGTDASGTQQYRLEFTAAKTGAANDFTITPGAGGGTSIDQLSGGAIVTQGQDAQIQLWPGTGSAQTVSSSSNTFSDVLDDVQLTVSKVTTSPATVEVATDTSATAANASSFISSVSTILSSIASNQKSSQSTGTDSSGNATTTTTFGAFSGNAAITALKQNLMAAVQNPVNGVSPSTIGISVDSDGTLSLDSTAFSAALASDPQGTMAMFQAISTRVNTVSAAASNPTTGTVTKAITAQQSTIAGIDSQIDDWTTRLANKQSALQTQFTAMEAALSKLNSTQTYLTAQMDSISAAAKS